MELNVNINPEDINKQIVEAVAKSAIGETLEKVIKNEVAKISTSYNNPLERVIRAEIERIVRETIINEHKPQLQKMVSKKLTEQITDDLLSKLWEIAVNKY